MKRLALLLLAILPFTAIAQSPISDSLVLTKDEAFMALPPVVVCQPHVTKMEWSSDGAYLLIYRLETNFTQISIQQMLAKQAMPRTDAAIVLWDNKNRRATEVWRGDASQWNVEDFEWFSKSPVALISLAQRPQQPDGEANYQLLRLNAVTAKHEKVLQLHSLLRLEPTLSSSPAADVVAYAYPRYEIDPAVGRVGLSASVVQFIRPVGANPQPLVLTRTPDTGMAFITAEGQFAYQRSEFDQQLRRAKHEYHVIDPTSLEVLVVTEMPKLWQPTPKVDLVGITTERQELGSRQPKKPVNSLWMHSAVPSRWQFTMLAAQVRSYHTAPGFQAVAYVTDGVGIVRPIARLPRANVEEALLASLRSSLMSDGKQVALGLLMYAGDNDDVLPGKDTDVKSLIDPYLKNSSLSKDFVYTFSGGDLGKVDKPAETVMGYIPGPGGKAVVYVDGHVKWIND